VGSTLITLVSVHIAANGVKGDPARLAAQIVSGIGFLGAGAIIREGASIKGLTTAASIWTTAGIGIAAGASPFLGELAVVATGTVLFTLWILNWLEDRIEARTAHIRTLEVQVHGTENASSKILSKLSEKKVEVKSLEYSAGRDAHVKIMLMRVLVPKGFDLNTFVADLGDEPGVVSVSV
jgi:putative Mg2+ transporter-C (MgtC) family protein